MKIAFDVDGTLLDLLDKPRYDVLELFFWFEERGHDMIVWSGSGDSYAEMIVRRLGLENRCRVITKCSVKVDIAVDDMMSEKNGSHKFAKVIIKV